MSWTGYIGVLIAVLGFGSNFVPLKRIKIGDGVFFQFCMCNAIFMTSIPVLIVQEFPKIHGLALLGGFLWCTGNMLCPIAIRFIGMGLGLLVWGCISMIMGWASGRFGLFGLHKQEIGNPGLNTVGMVLAIVGLLVFLQVKPNDTSVDNQKQRLSSDSHAFLSPLVADEEIDTVNQYDDRKVNISLAGEESGTANTDDLAPATKRIAGLSCAIAAGVLFGCNFDPAQYVIDHQYDGNDNTLNYVFAHFTGIILTSWFYTIMYCVYHQYHGTKPYVSSEIILPATISGALWAMAQIAWFYANGQLGFAITFPIISCGPGFIGSLWGIFLFKEISGRVNFLLLGVAALITIPALIVVALSH
jgi:glucose uptake protein GlcU